MIKGPLISIIIVNWNGKRWLQKCLDSLLMQTYTNYEIIFVDNASSDDSVEYVGINYPTVKIVEIGTNLGFAGGNNKGIEVAKGELILLLNNDTWVENNFIEDLYKYYISSKSDVVGPVEAFYDGKLRPYTNTSLIDFFGHPVQLKNESKSPFYLSGVGLLFSKQTYIKTGGLDDNFFMYAEEVDWFWRLHLYKKRISIARDINIYHAGAGSLGTGLKTKTFLWRNQNTLQMLLKNYKLYNLLWVIPIYFIQNIIEIIAFICFGKFMIAYSYILGWHFNLNNLSRTLIEREKIQKLRQVNDSTVLKMMYSGSGKFYHLLNYFKIK